MNINTNTQGRLQGLHDMLLLPQDHVNYLYKIQQTSQPKVIYDIGACVLHWTNIAKNVWPDAKFYLFEAMDEVEFLYKKYDYEYELGAFSDTSGKEIDFYQNTYHPGGNSYYRENPEYSDGANALFGDDSKIKKITKTIDEVVKSKNFKLPDLIKIDVQGCELDIMRGMPECIDHASDIIVEMQQVQYNKGAPLVHETAQYILDQGFAMVGYKFSNSHPDAPDSDYHFRKVRQT